MPAIAVMVQLFQSLFLTGDKPNHRINPIAILLALGLGAFARDQYLDWKTESKIVKSSEIVQEQAARKITRINKVNKDEDEAKEAITDDDLSAWSELVNGMQRKQD